MREVPPLAGTVNDFNGLPITTDITQRIRYPGFSLHQISTLNSARLIKHPAALPLLLKHAVRQGLSH